MVTVTKRRPVYQTVMGGALKGREYDGEVIHRALAARALDTLTEPGGAGFFEKAALLRAFAQEEPRWDYAIRALEEQNQIHWDYIVRWLAEQYGAELIPLAHHFFVAHPIGPKYKGRQKALSVQISEAMAGGNMADAKILGGRALASGHGKKTAGWASVRLSNGALVVARLERKKAVAFGSVHAAHRAEHEALDRAPGLLTGGAAPLGLVSRN
jgi:hypothetical protein